MVIPSIPEEILCHSCLLSRYCADDITGEERLVSQVRLKKVRVALHRKRVSDGRMRDISYGTLYYDCFASIPQEVDFFGEDNEGGFYTQVTFRGKKLRVVSVRYIYGGEQLHHIEAELEGG
ncbi:MAG: putative minor capsid protein [Huintestinicola sp.]